MKFYIFDSQQAAIDLLAKINSILGFPRLEGHTETWAEIKKRIDGKFVFPCVDTARFPDFESKILGDSSFDVLIEDFADNWFPEVPA